MSSELVPLQVSGLALPDHLKTVTGKEGLENVGKEDLILPRLVICQSTHPQRKKANPLYIEGLEDGKIFNTVTNEIYGEKVEIIPLMFAKSRIYFRDLKEGGGILCRSINGINGGSISPTCEQCPNSKFSPDKPPACNIFMNFPSILVGNKQLIAASFKSMALKNARNWVTRMTYTNKPIYAGVYEVKVQPQSNSKGDFFVPVFTLKRWTTLDEFKFAEAAYNNLKGRTILTDEDPQSEHNNDEDLPF